MYWEGTTNKTSNKFLWEGVAPKVVDQPNYSMTQFSSKINYLTNLSDLYIQNEFSNLDKEREGELGVINAGLAKEESRLRARFSGSGLNSSSFEAFINQQLESRNKEIEWINTEYDARKRAIEIEVGNQLTTEQTMKDALKEAGIAIPKKVKPKPRMPYDWSGGTGDLGGFGSTTGGLSVT